jgi:hypothetical protein
MTLLLPAPLVDTDAPQWVLDHLADPAAALAWQELDHCIPG